MKAKEINIELAKKLKAKYIWIKGIRKKFDADQTTISDFLNNNDKLDTNLNTDEY